VVLYFQSPARVATTEEEEEEEEEKLHSSKTNSVQKREAGSHKRDVQHCPFESIRKGENRRWELMGTYGSL
jgi:hypothetical protein